MNIKNGSLEETNFDLIIEIHVLILLKRIYLKSDIYIYIYIYSLALSTGTNGRSPQRERVAYLGTFRAPLLVAPSL